MITRKDLERSDREVRFSNYIRTNHLINELYADDVLNEEKMHIAKEIADSMWKHNSWEEESCKFWFEDGKLTGMSLGIILGAGIFFIGERVGKLIVSKIES